MLNQWFPNAEGKLDTSCIDENDYLKQEYADMVKAAAQGLSNSNAEHVTKGISAVVFTGGEDISPTLYAQSMPWHGIADEKDYCAERDISDYLLPDYCLDQDIPILGLCRGMQMLGIVSGCGAIQDIPTFYAEQGVQYGYCHRNQKETPDSYRDYASHAIDIQEGSLLRQIVGADRLMGCASWHHQAVNNADGQVITAAASYTDNGIEIIEALERSDKTFAQGLQFHPEASIVKHLNAADNASDYMDYSTALRFFTSLIDSAK